MAAPGLTPKQEAFCHAYLKLGDAAKAYREVYKSKSTTKDSTIWTNASAMMSNTKVSGRIEELRAPIVKKALITFESHLEDLKRIRDAACEVEQFGAATTAEVSRGKVAGLYSGDTINNYYNQTNNTQININLNMVILKALEPYPEARKAVVAALEAQTL